MIHGFAPAMGRALVLLVSGLLALDGLLQFISPPFMVEGMMHAGFAADAGPRLAFVTLGCAILLAIPATAPLGAVLVTGFLGGAIAIHFRLGEIGSPPQLICLLLGVAAWTGLYLADPRLQRLIVAEDARVPLA
ncbi:DoxX family protein [Sphingomonas sanxanigenens]|uniref:DoxX family protein n=1 Tax=Sphingomonas sanxanigenens DSM 19645 = NX02 TaxID=1123269 RepID=W0AI88_9SPHN|nr:DoxX family protein [Sphingomonas sanxanigenens]AHE55375.1 hypothetical protein NX02_18530 [Sphingomonas sanxanigenens DSM 19645 = NX02]